LAELRVHRGMPLREGSGRHDKRLAIGRDRRRFRTPDARGGARALEPNLGSSPRSGRDFRLERTEKGPAELADPLDLEDRSVAHSERKADLAATALGAEELAKRTECRDEFRREDPTPFDVENRVARRPTVAEGDPSPFGGDRQPSAGSVAGIA